MLAIAVKQMILLFLLLPMWGLPPATTYEINKCNCIEQDVTPTMRQLNLLDVPEIGVSIRIMDKIGSDYHTLGTYLLNDDDGGTMKKITRDHKSTDEILNEIFRCWIKEGQKDGKKMNTWKALIKYLKHSKFMALADEIEAVLRFCTNVTLHMDHEECQDHNVVILMGTKSLLQKLAPALVAVIVGAAIIIILLYYRRSITGSAATEDEYTEYLKSFYETKTQASFTDDDHWPPPVTNKTFKLAMIKFKEVQRRRIDRFFIFRLVLGMIDDILGSESRGTGVPATIQQICDKHKQIRALIEGAPGCGKSTLSVHICHEWRAGRLLNEYSKVILVRLREIEIQNAKNVSDLLPLRKYTNMAHDVEKSVFAHDGKGVLFIFDGWDELPSKLQGCSIIKDILQGKTLHKSSFIVTSRPTSSMNLHKLVDERIEILGFNKDEQQKYFADCLGDDQSKVKKLQQSIKENPVIESSCYLPLNASIIVHLFKCDGVLPSTRYGIFSALICNCIFRDLKKKGKHPNVLGIKSLDELPAAIQGPFDSICKMAYEGVINDRIIFDLGPNFNTLGLLQGIETFTGGMLSHSYNFLHLSIQELLAAFHMATKLEPDEQVAQFKKHIGRARFTAVLQFYAAKTKLKTRGMDEIISEVIQICTQNKEETEFTSHSDTEFFGHKPQPLLLWLLHCLFEALEDKTLCQLVAKELKGQLSLQNISLNPADCLIVGYFITKCRLSKVYLGRCSIDIDGCNSLFGKDQYYFADLQYLDLSENSFGDEGAIFLSGAINAMPNLQTLDLDWNYISDAARKTLKEAAKNKGIKLSFY